MNASFSHFIRSLFFKCSCLVLLLSQESVLAQCTGNLLANGSFEGIPGEDVTASGWTGNNSPDLNIVDEPLHSTGGFEWTGTPIASEDGGTWQNMFGPEDIRQTLTLVPGQTYILQFWYAAQGIASDDFLFDGPVGVRVSLNEIPIDSTADDQTPFTWEHACFVFTATETTVVLRLLPTQGQYVAVDGICLLPTSAHVPEIDLGNNFTMCTDKVVTLHAGSIPGARFEWQDASTAPDLEVTQAGTYWVTVVANCREIGDTIHISTIPCQDADPFLAPELPNVFTPDGDGDNDYFQALQAPGESSVVIVNRWGVKVYDGPVLAPGWDGKSGGEPCSEGNYFWILHYTDAAGQKAVMQGFVTLIR